MTDRFFAESAGPSGAPADSARWDSEPLDSPARDLRYAKLKHPHPDMRLAAEVGGLWYAYRAARQAADAAEAEFRNALGHAAVATVNGDPAAVRVIRVQEDYFVPLPAPEDKGES